jgi:hypothetical protein
MKYIYLGATIMQKNCTKWVNSTSPEFLDLFPATAYCVRSIRSVRLTKGQPILSDGAKDYDQSIHHHVKTGQTLLDQRTTNPVGWSKGL